MIKKKQRTFLQKLTTLLMFSMVFAVGAWAQLTNGKVYNFESIGRAGKSLSSSDKCDNGQATTNHANPHQLWIAVEGKGKNQGKFVLRNLGNGLYLQSSQQKDKAWTMVPTIALDDSSYNYCVKKDGSSDIYVMSDNAQGTGDKCMHLLTDKVICGNSNDKNSQWRIKEVPKTDEEIKKQLEKVAKFENERTEYYRALIYEKTLYKIFTDKSCTRLTSKYESMAETELEQDADYMKLPSVLRKTVKKVKSNNWTEKNANSNKPEWDDIYARKFRVQLYEPYSDPHEAGLALHIQPHTVLNNPTGIYASKGDTIYVMVEGEIKTGADLYFSTYKGYDRPVGDARRGTKLKEGLNIIPFNGDSINTFVCYTVETFKNRQKTGRKLSEYKDLKIHIEGGSLNGYYNHMGDSLYKADKNEDWDYYEKRANMPFITIVGKYQVLQLYKDSIKSNDGKTYPGLSSILNEKVKIEDVITAWDKLMFNQRLTLGVLSKEEIEEAREKYPTLDNPKRGIYGYIGDDSIAAADYSDSYRVHGMSLGQLTGYMVGSNSYSGYNISTFEAITVGLASKEHNNFGNIWGVAHEIGHQHQALLHMNGLKESSNNIFSNVAVWFDGKATSNMADGALENLLKVYNRKDGDFFHTTLGVQMHLYYKLWLYYHLAGKNNKFYPRLFELLRQDPMNITVDQDGAQSLLHFYKMCCKAAGEDLTEFFRAHCFFTPLKQRHVADYTSSDYTMTQEQVDAAIAEVKSWNFPLNRNIIFINDCAGKPVYSHDGKTQRHIYNGKPNADMGMYTDFITPEEGKVQGLYSYRFSEGKIVMSGAKGGVGFLAYDDEGMLQAFSDRYSFALSERARKKLSSQKLHFYVIDGNGNLTEIKGNDVVGEQRELLRAAMDDAKELLKKVDEENRRVGFFHKQAVSELERLLAEAEKVYEEKKKEAYISTSYLLTEECRKINESQDSRITFVPNSTYLLECQYAPNQFIYRESDNKLALKKDTTNASQWLFELAGENSYYLKHVGTNKYMSKAEKSIAVKLVDKKDASTYHIETLEDNYFALGSGTGYLNYDHNGGKVWGWAKIEGTQSRWRLLLVDVQDSEKAYQDLAKSADIAEALVRKAAVMKEVKLQATKADSTGYLYSNAPSSKNESVNGSANNGYNLLDKDINTYFHSETDNNINSKDSLDHYLKVDLKGLNFPVMSMHYTTRNADSKERPKTIRIEGSGDGRHFTPIMTISQGLPQHRTTAYETPLMDASYRYLRFMVTATYGAKTSKGHPYFSMSSFGLVTPVLLEKYASTSTELEALLEEIKATRKALEGGREQMDNLKATKEKLDSAYAKFAAACKAIDDQIMQSKKKQLEALIEKTDALLKEVATVDYEENRNVATPVPVSLQCTNAQGKAYISSNADQNGPGNDGQISGGSEPALIDKNVNTFYHSRWKGTPVNEPHNIQIKLTNVESDAEFDFSYTTRHNGGPYPTALRIEQSKDGVNFTTVKEFTQEADTMPAKNATQWNSPKLTPNGTYRYLRFVVTKSTKFDLNQYSFAMSEFSFNNYEYKTDINVSKKEELSCVSDSQVIDTELSKVIAQSITAMTVSETMLDEQLAELQQVYDSLFKAKEASAPYNELKEYSQTPDLPMRELKAGNKVGQWKLGTTEAYNRAYVRAAYLLSYKGAEAKDYVAALEAWKKAYEDLAVNQPETGKLYTVRKADGKGASLLCVDSDNILRSSTDTNSTQSNAVWTFVTETGKLYMKSLHTASFLSEISEGNKLVEENAAAIELKPLADDGQVALVKGNAPDNPTVTGPIAGKTATSGWYIEEVEAPESVGHDLTVSTYGYAGLYLDYPVQMPEGTETYTVSAIDGNAVTLSRIASSLVPASTAVIVKAPAGRYRLAYAESATPAESANLLCGSSFTRYMEGEASTSYYLFGVKTNNVGLYKAWLEYSDNGTIADGNKGTDKGGHFKVSANKVYLPLSGSTQPTSLTFNFDGIHTGINGQQINDGPTIIYDLSGRRIHKILHTGLYIVNGRKVYLNDQGHQIQSFQ